MTTAEGAVIREGKTACLGEATEVQLNAGPRADVTDFEG